MMSNSVDGVFKSQWKQFLAALAASLTMISVGTEEYWLLQTLEDTKYVTDLEETLQYLFWVVIISAAASSAIGAIIGAVLADSFGRRRVLLSTSIFAISQVIGTFSTSIALRYVALLLGEIGVGITRVLVPLYVSEIVDDKIRGTLLMLQLPFFYCGKMIVVGFRDLLSIRISGIILITITCLFLATFTWFPETPHYLASRKHHDVKIRSIAFYRSMKKIVVEDEIELSIKNADLLDANNDSRGCCDRFKELTRPSNRKGLIILLFLITAKWSEQIFDIHNDFAHVMLDTCVSTDQARIITYVISLLTTILIVFTIDDIGRRTYLLFSTSICFVLIIFILLPTRGVNLQRWFYQGAAIIFHFCRLIIFSIPLVYVGEFFSSNVRALAIAIVTAFNLTIGIIIVALSETMNFDPSSYCAGILLLFAFPITLAFIPETKRKSLQNIEKELATITFHWRWLRDKFDKSDQTQ